MWIGLLNAVVTQVCRVIIRFGSVFLAVQSISWMCDKLWKNLAAGSVRLNVSDRNNVLLWLRLRLSHFLPLFSLSLHVWPLFVPACLLFFLSFSVYLWDRGGCVWVSGVFSTGCINLNKDRETKVLWMGACTVGLKVCGCIQAVVYLGLRMFV